MFTPTSKVPDSKSEQKKWAKEWMRGVLKAVEASFRSKTQDKFCYDIWNGLQNVSDYDYLRKVGEMEYPAKVRFVPLLRPRGDRLRTIEESRGLMKRVFTIDQDSIRKKEDLKVKDIINNIQTGLNEKYSGIQAKVNELKGLEKKLAEGGGENPELQGQIETIMQTLHTEKYVLDVNSNSLSKDIQEIEKYYDYEYKDLLEEMMEGGLDYLIQKYDLRTVVSNAFTDLLVTDKPYFCIDFAKNGKDPSMRRVSPLNLYYSNDDDVDWIDECEWVAEERWMTVAQIMDEFAGELTAEEVEKIQNIARSSTTPYSNSNKWAYEAENHTPSGNVECGPGGMQGGYEDYGNRIRVIYGTWIGQAKLRYKKSKDKRG